jgi:hypothetical protein
MFNVKRFNISFAKRPLTWNDVNNLAADAGYDKCDCVVIPFKYLDASVLFSDKIEKIMRKKLVYSMSQILGVDLTANEDYSQYLVNYDAISRDLALIIRVSFKKGTFNILSVKEMAEGQMHFYLPLGEMPNVAKYQAFNSFGMVYGLKE